MKTIKEHHKLSFETIFTDSLSFYGAPEAKGDKNKVKLMLKIATTMI